MTASATLPTTPPTIAAVCVVAPEALESVVPVVAAGVGIVEAAVWPADAAADVAAPLVGVALEGVYRM